MHRTAAKMRHITAVIARPVVGVSMSALGTPLCSAKATEPIEIDDICRGTDRVMRAQGITY